VHRFSGSHGSTESGLWIAKISPKPTSNGGFWFGEFDISTIFLYQYKQFLSQEQKKMVWIVLKYAAYCMGCYILAALTFLATAKFERNADGNLSFDPNAFHFKVAYYFAWKEYISHPDSKYWETFKVGLCPYFLNLLWMTIIAWPIIGVWEALKFCIYNLVLLPFGFYSTPDIGWAWASIDDCFTTDVNSMGLGKFLPIYVVAPLTWVYLFMTHRIATLHYTWATLKWTAIVVGIIGTLLAVAWFCDTDEKNVSVVRAGINAHWRRFCPYLVPKLPTKAI